MATLEILIRSQNTRAGRIERLVSNMQKLGKEKITIHVLRKRQALLEEYWREFVSRHEEILRFPESEKEDYLTADVYQRVEEAYLDQFAELDELIEDHTSLDASDHPGRLFRASTLDQDREPAFPTISLPSFSGDLLSWESFRDRFKSLIHDSPRLSNVRKLHYLKSSLDGEAARMLDRTPVTGENYEGAWEALERRYGNKRVLVNAYMRRLLQVPSSIKGLPSELKCLLDEFRQARQSLKALERPVATWDDWFTFLLTEKLDNATRLQWELSLAKPTEIPKLGALEEFLETRLHAISVTHPIELPPSARSRETTGRSGHPGLSSGSNHGAGPRHAAISTRKVMALKTETTEKASKPKSTRQCLICKGNHSVSFCSKYKQLSAGERRVLIRRLDACLGCLNLGHTISECPSVNRCLVCESKHHTTLHDAFLSEPTAPSGAARARSTTAATSSAATYSVSARRGVLLATARVRLLSPDGRDVIARALLDSGSESSFLSDRIVGLLGLKRKPVNVVLTGYQGTRVGVARHEVNVRLTSLLDESFCVPVRALVTDSVTTPTPSQPIQVEDWPHVRDLPLADPAFDTTSDVDMLLGADIVGALYQERRMGPPGTPVAICTPLGWILLGPVATVVATPPFPTESKLLHTRCCDTLQATLTRFWSLEVPSPQRETNSAEEGALSVRTLPTSSRVMSTRCCHELNTALRRFWEIEELPSTPILSPDDAFCERHFSQTHSRDSSGRYCVRLPFRVEGTTLPRGSRAVALRLLLSSERRQLRDPDLKAKYRTFMEDYKELGHMEVVESSPSPAGLYLPHHAVWKKNDERSKIRVVFNASFNQRSGESLNDLLLPGPKLQKELWLVLTRWRCYRFVLSADIVKMFRQIQVHPDDRDWQRILWRPNPETEVQDFRLATVTYGTSPAPFLALRTLLQLADDEQHRFPLGAEMLRKHCYVDDILFGADDPESLKEVRRQLTGILDAGGFPLDKWASNDVALGASLGVDTKLLQDKETHAALGLLWNSQHDSLAVRGPELPSVSSGPCWTKRAVLSDIARLFDPMGWLAPVLVRAKIFIQDLWLAGVEWDEPLTEHIVTAWESFRNSIGRLNQVSVPRWVGCSGIGESHIELHGFCDASERAFAAAVYLAVRRDDGSAKPHLLLAKTRVAPIKVLSIPRLELCGALLLARLLTSVQKGLGFSQVTLFAWSDSTVALDWIKEHASRWPVFIAHRVAEIQQLLPELNWRYARSTDNHADLATRGITPEELLESRLWWNGPPWLKGPPSTWPSRKPTRTLESSINVGTVGTQETTENYLARFSSFSRLVRVTARILRLFANAKSAAGKRTGFLTTSELMSARTVVCRCSQTETFAEELDALSRGKEVRVSSVLATCRPFLDVNGLIRVGGRLDKAPINYDERHPVVIGKNSQLATLLVRYTHLRLLHAGVRQTTSHLFRHFWIPKSHTFIKQVIGACVTCLRFRGATSNQLMGSLPLDRVSPAKPFLNSGVDYAGPILLRTGKGRGYKSLKGYIAVFACLSTKAVHLEAVTDLTTNDFIGAFKRFTARRGRCQHLRSDNGTNFKGADAQLRAMFKAASRFHEDIAELLANDGTDWEFNPPAAPHHGGLWEAAVKSVKTHLKKVMKTQILTFEEMTTLLCQIEACLNSRPLCPLSSDPLDLGALTPGHLLTGEPLTLIPEPYDPHTTTSITDRWNMITKMRNNFWYRWRADYLHTLQHRAKWRRPTTNLKVGSLVILKDELTPPSKWPLARIIESLPGRDGLVRIVKLRTASTTLIRPVTKVVPLLDTSKDSSMENSNASP